MDWDDLKYVLAVARAKSFLRASTLLKVSHTTVSRRISALESRLGSTLFDRNHNECIPTRACEAMLDAAERIESEIHSIRQNLKDVGTTPEGPVWIATMPWIINHILVPALPDLFTQYPGIQLRFLGVVFDKNDCGRVPGLSLRFELQPSKREIARNIATFNYAVYGLAGTNEEALPWVGFDEKNLQFPLRTWLQDQGVAFHDVQMLGNDAGIVHGAIRAGVGKGLIPEYLGEADPGLSRLSGKDPEIVRHLRAVIDPRTLALSRIKAVLDWLEETLPDCTAPDPSQSAKDDG